jgi:hypothetical protein
MPASRLTPYSGQTFIVLAGYPKGLERTAMAARIHKLHLLMLATSALFVLSAVGPSAGVLGSLPAQAQGNGGGNGNGGGGGNGNGNGGGGNGESHASANGNSGTAGNSASAPGHNKVGGSAFASASESHPSNAGKGNNAAGKTKVAGLDAQLGALHAVNANLQAFIHANPTSRVGKLATYAAATVAVEEAQADLTDAVAAFDASLMTFKATYIYTSYDLQTLQGRFDELSALASPTSDETLELQALQTILTSQEATDLIAAQGTLSDAEDTATAALDDAANKPVTDEVKAYVDAALQTNGVLDYYRSQ